MKASTFALLCFVVLVLPVSVLAALEGAEDDTVRQVLAGELPAGATVIEIENVDLVEGSLRIEVFSPAFSPWVRIFEEGSSKAAIPISGGLAVSPIEPAVMGVESIPGKRYRLEIRAAAESWGGPYEVIIRNRDHQLPQISSRVNDRKRQIVEYADSRGDPILEARAKLANELLPMLVEESSVPELMSQFPGNQLLGLWDPRWQRLRWQYELVERFRDRRQGVEEVLESLQSMLGADHPVVASARLQLAEELWQTGQVTESGELIVAVLTRLAENDHEGHALRPTAELARGRWLRRVGALNAARRHLEEARSGFKASLSDHSLAVSYTFEELGALEWDRGEFESAETALDRSLQIRLEILGPSDRRHLSVLKRLAVAQLAQAVTSAGPESDKNAADQSPQKAKKKKKKDLKPQALPLLESVQPTCMRIAAMNRDSEQTVPRLDRAWALSVMAATTGDSLRQSSADSQERWAKSQLAIVGDYPNMKRRADHVSSWSPKLYRDAQKVYAAAAANSSSTDAARDRAQSLLRSGELSRSNELLKRVRSVAESELGPDHFEVAIAEAELANQRWRAEGDLSEVADAIERSIETLRSSLGSDAVPVGQLLTDLARLKAEMGQYEEAMVLAFEARSILTSQLSFASPIRVRYFPRLAWTFREARMFEEMEATLAATTADQSLSICTALHLNSNLMLADLKIRQEDLPAARSLVKAEIDRCGDQGALGKNLAPLQDILEDDYVARDKAKKAAGLDDFYNRGKKRKKKALLWGGLFIVAAPIALFSFAWGVTAVGVAGMPAGSFGALAVLGAMGATGVASPFMMAKDMSHPRYKLAPVLDPAREADYYQVVGTVLRDSGSYREAAALYRGAIKGMEKGAAKGHPRLIGIYRDLAEVLWDTSGLYEGDRRRKDQQQALLAAESSVEILNNFLHEAVSTLPEQQALSLISSRPRPEAIVFSGALYAAKDKEPWLEAAWNWALRKRSLVLDELAFRHQQAIDSDTPATAQAWEDFVESRRRLASLWVRGPEAGYTHWPELQDALEERERAEKALAASSPGFRSSEAYKEVGYREVVAAMPARTALVEFVRVPVRPPGPSDYTDHYVALILGQGTVALYADLGPADEIDTLVQNWLRELRNSYESSETGGRENSPGDDGSGSELRRRVWDPVVQQVTEVDRLFVVLDGSLNQVHFPALPDKEGGYVIDRTPGVHTLTSGRDLVRIQRETDARATGMLALGNPDFDLAEVSATTEGAVESSVYRGPQARCGALREHRWQPLPETETEVKDIAALYEEREDVILYTGAAATEDHLKRMAPGKRYLHIATHGFFLQEECHAAGGRDRGIGLLVPDTTKEILDPNAALAFGDNPLLLSGLVLAGANNASQADKEAEDGIATAEELAALDLRGLEIAALSACDTGRGTVATGEGVFGLRRALEIAGARTVLMSLWPVPDEAGRKWMTRFYERKFEGESVQQATWETSLELLHEQRREGRSTHPYLWAGFVAAGDWR